MRVVRRLLAGEAWVDSEARRLPRWLRRGSAWRTPAVMERRCFCVRAYRERGNEALFLLAAPGAVLPGSEDCLYWSRYSPAAFGRSDLAS